MMGRLTQLMSVFLGVLPPDAELPTVQINEKLMVMKYMTSIEL